MPHQEVYFSIPVFIGGVRVVIGSVIIAPHLIEINTVRTCVGKNSVKKYFHTERMGRLAKVSKVFFVS